MNQVKIVEMFSGIGSQAKALHRVAERKQQKIHITKTCEWNIHAFVAYNFIHNTPIISDEVQILTKEQVVDILSEYTISSDGISPINEVYLKSLPISLLKTIYQSIINNNNLVNIKEVKGSDIPNDTDLLTYSFPCQDLSNVGSFHGYKFGIDKNMNTRSGLLWEVERILEEKRDKNEPLPKFLLLENVTALEASRHKGNFNEWKDKLESLGYINKVYKLNALNFGIPQNRNRLIMLSVYVGNNYELKNLVTDYWARKDLNSLDYIKSLSINTLPLNWYLRLDYNQNYQLSEALLSQPNATKSRAKIWAENYQIVKENGVILDKVQTITTKQDRHPNSGNIFFNPNNDKARFRFLTPRECFILMGFDEIDYEILTNNNFTTRGNSLFFSRDILYKLAGNSIVVNVLEYVFEQLLEIKDSIYPNLNVADQSLTMVSKTSI